LMLLGDEGEAEHAREPGDRLVIVADDRAMWARDWGIRTMSAAAPISAASGSWRPDKRTSSLAS
jgi:hypothetical protein